MKDDEEEEDEAAKREKWSNKIDSWIQQSLQPAKKRKKD